MILSLEKVSINRKIGSLILGKQHKQIKKKNSSGFCLDSYQSSTRGRGVIFTRSADCIITHSIIVLRQGQLGCERDTRQLEQPEETIQ